MRFKARFWGRGAWLLAATALLGYVVMLLWNATVADVLAGIRYLDYRQALCLLVLSRILVGSFLSRGGTLGRRWQRRLDRLTPVERDRFQRGDCYPNTPPGSTS